jgi:hypothetical protein
MNDYPPSGVLFQNDRKKNEKSPDYTGQIELSDEVVNDLVDQMSRGITKPKVSLIGWKKVSQKTGKPFLSLLGNAYEERPNGAAQQQPQKLDDNIPF